MKKQQGYGLLLILLLLALAVMGFLLVLKLSPLYIDNYSVKQIFEGLQQQQPQKIESDSDQTLEQKIELAFETEGLSEFFPDVNFTNLGISTAVAMEYERRVGLVSNIDIVVTFEHYVEISE